MKKVKKILAILLVLCMTLALAACGGNGGGSTGGDTTGGGSTGGDTTGGGSTGGDTTGGGEAPAAGGPAELGFYDRGYDYTQHKNFRIAYLVSAPGVMFDSFDVAFERWSERLNINYAGMWAPAESSNEAFLSGVEQHADMGFDGLLIDTDPNLSSRVAEICGENNLLWMMAMAQARDYSQPYTILGEYSIGPLYAPNVGFNNIAVGRTMAEGLIEWKEKTYPDTPWEEVGFISINFSLSPQINERTLGAKQVWAETNPSFGEYNPDPSSELRNFIIADAATGAFNQETASNLVTQIFSNPPDPNVKVWLIAASFWDFAAGASVVAENLNMIDQVCVTTFGAGANAISLWEAGVPTTIRLSLETASPVFAEAIINALWTMMAGFATPDTLWPEWAVIWDKGDKYELSSELDPVYQVPTVVIGDDGKPVVLEEHNYASLVLPMIWVDSDNYKEFYGWVDLYDLGPDADPAERSYPDFPLGTDINAFNARAEVPAYYTQYPTP